MEENLTLVITLLTTLSAALVLGWTTFRLGLSPLVGYLLAGVALGFFTPGSAGNREIARSLADLGIILLMFGIGLNFHVKQLIAVRRIALPGALIQSTLITLVATLLALRLGWSLTTSLIFGLCLAVESTVVLSRIIADSNELQTRQGRVVLGWLVVEDILTVMVLVVISAMAGRSQTAAVSLLLAVAKIGVFVLFTFLVGNKLIPLILNRIAVTRSKELFTLTILVLTLGIAVGASVLFGISIALGAFLAGMIVGRSEFSLRAATEALPFRDAFAVLFFVSIGMLLQPGPALAHPLPILVALGCILICKPILAFAITTGFRYPLRTALTAALGFTQIGEFSFILVAFANRAGLGPELVVNTIVSASILSLVVSPLLFRLRGPAEALFSGNRVLYRWISSRAGFGAGSGNGPSAGLKDHAIIVGYGPVGSSLANLLRRNGIDVVVIEMNLDTVHALQQQGIDAVYGDASHKPVIESTSIDQASSFIITAPGREVEEAIRLARESNAGIQILARAAYVLEKPVLLRAGADRVFTGEEEIALAMAEHILRDLGASPEQIEREREQLRDNA